VTQPTTVGSYKVVRTLGAGLMGPVYLGTHQNQYWVLRILSDNAIRSTTNVNKLVGDVLHPCVVRYREVGVDPQVGGFVSTDYIEARPIHRDALAGQRSHGRLQFLLRLAEGLKTMHGRGIMHGCIKRSNVLLRKDDDRIEGLCLDAGFTYVPSPQLLPRLLAGAFPTMAPELIEAYQSGDRNAIERTLTPQVDIYAFGILVAEVLSGRPAYATCRDLADLLAVKRSTRLHATGINDPHGHLDLAALDAAIGTATATDPGQRPASIQVLIDQLSAALKRAA